MFWASRWAYLLTSSFKFSHADSPCFCCEISVPKVAWLFWQNKPWDLGSLKRYQKCNGSGCAAIFKLQKILPVQSLFAETVGWIFKKARVKRTFTLKDCPSEKFHVAQKGNHFKRKGRVFQPSIFEGASNWLGYGIFHSTLPPPYLWVFVVLGKLWKNLKHFCYKKKSQEKKTSKTSHLSNLISTRLFWPHLQLLVTRHPHYLHPARPQGQCPQIWGENTVDGRSPAPVGMVNIPLFTRFYTSQVV